MIAREGHTDENAHISTVAVCPGPEQRAEVPPPFVRAVDLNLLYNLVHFNVNQRRVGISRPAVQIRQDLSCLIGPPNAV